jgi:DNA-binding PadR family transcriptional regulator
VAVVLEDAVLVLLGARSRSAYELWQDHSRIFAGMWPVDIRRVMDAVVRLERAGLVRVDSVTPSRQTSSNRRACHLTPTGRRRQAEWLCALAPDLPAEEMYIRGMLAVDAADPVTFEAFLAAGLAGVEQRRRDLDPGDGGDLVARATIAFDREITVALARWLRALGRYRKAAARTRAGRTPARS